VDEQRNELKKTIDDIALAMIEEMKKRSNPFERTKREIFFVQL
jgi:hypothetical protein